ncbi:hypothetical protein Ddc_06663 [Ditylenchus destructor]|nr:hypothetical protein Ddc_06663 [Ditylenchus destructor]
MAQSTAQINSYVEATKEVLEAIKLHADQTRKQQGSDDSHVRALKEISFFAAKTATRLMQNDAEANVADNFTKVLVLNGTYVYVCDHCGETAKNLELHMSHHK